MSRSSLSKAITEALSRHERERRAKTERAHGAQPEVRRLTARESWELDQKLAAKFAQQRKQPKEGVVRGFSVRFETSDGRFAGDATMHFDEAHSWSTTTAGRP